MATGGTSTFQHLEAYVTELGDARVKLTITGAGEFSASVTRLKLNHLQIFRCCEKLSRIAFVTLPPGRIFLSFPIGPQSPIFGNLALRNREFLLHGIAERVHQRSSGACKWGMIALSFERLAKCSKMLTGRIIAPSSVSRVLRPGRAEAYVVHTLFRQACRFAENPGFIEHSEVARKLEQEMSYAIVQCIAAAEAVDPRSNSRQQHTAVMARFEDILIKHFDEKIGIPELCAELGVPDRTFRACCAEHLGISPARYMLLLRLNRVRAILQRANPRTARVSEVALKHQFKELGRFSVTYRTIFGESPSVTLQRNRDVELAEGA